MSLLTKSLKSVDESAAVTEAFVTWQSARDHYEGTKGRARELKIQLKSDSETDALVIVHAEAALPAALKDQAQAMDEVITVDNDIRAIYEEACQILGPSQRVIPQAGLPLLDKSAGQSHWEFLQGWYRKEGWVN